jgi:hypothetical protein
MDYIKRYKGRELLICFLAVTLSSISPASPLSSDIRQSEEIGPGGFPVEFQWDEIERTTGKSWSPDGSKPINNFIHKTDDMSTQFAPGPVEDPVPDPTMKSASESLKTYLKNLGTPLPANVEIPEDPDEKAEIPPDLLVEFGDGKTFFGGDGKKVIDNSEGSTINRQEWTFSWQVTRKKKPL